MNIEIPAGAKGVGALQRLAERHRGEVDGGHLGISAAAHIQRDRTGHVRSGELRTDKGLLSKGVLEKLSVVGAVADHLLHHNLVGISTAVSVEIGVAVKRIAGVEATALAAVIAQRIGESDAVVGIIAGTDMDEDLLGHAVLGVIANNEVKIDLSVEVQRFLQKGCAVVASTPATAAKT